MPVIKIENFGGEMPSVSARALPDAAAQENSNLFAGTTEFRPLKSDLSVGVSVSSAKSLYRIDPSQPWITSTQERSYVRGQINGEVNKRTYYSINSPGQPPRALDATGEDRLLGVPTPAKPVVTVTAVDEVTWDEADAWLRSDDGAPAIRRAIAANRMPSDVSQYFQAGVPLAGAYSAHGLLLPTNALVPASLRERIYCMFGTINAASLFPSVAGIIYATRIASELGAVIGGEAIIYVPIAAAPYKFQANVATLDPVLAAIKGPDGTTGLLNRGMIDAIKGHAEAILNPDNYAKNERDELNDLVRAFAAAVAEATFARPAAPAKETFTYSDVSVTPPVTRDVSKKPTGPQYDAVSDGVGGEGGNISYVYSTAWRNYDAAVAAYEAAATGHEVQQAETLRGGEDTLRKLVDMQHRAMSLLQQIEAKGIALWRRISEQASEIESLISTLGGVSRLVPYAVTRQTDTRFYLVTFVTDWGEESAPSPVSDLVEVDQNDTIAINRPAVASAVSYNSRHIVAWRVYRSNVGSDSAAFQYVGEADVATATLADAVPAAALGEVLPTTTWMEPPSLRGMVGMPNGVMAGFTGNTVAFCEPYTPYAWPVAYQITTEYPIVGMGAFGQTLFVGTTGNPYFITGSDSASMSALKMESNQSCSSARSIASVQGGVLFASPDGLCVADAAGVKVITQGIYTREDWQALSPSTMFAAEHEGIYYLFYNNGAKGCLAFDLASKKLGRVSLQADAAFNDLVSDTLYVANGTSILAIFGGATRRTARWKSKRMTMPAQAGMAWLKVYGDQTPDAPVTLRLYGDGALAHTATVTNINPQRLPPGRWLEFEVDVESQSRVTRVVIAGSTQELQAV